MTDSTPKKKAVTPPSTPTARAAPAQSRAATLDELTAHAAPADEALSNLLALGLDDDQRLAWGRAIDSDVVLTAATAFAHGAYSALESLTEAQRDEVVGANLATVDLLVHACAALQARKSVWDRQSAEGDVSRSERRTAARKAMRDGIALRDRVYTGLRNVTPTNERDTLDAAVGTAVDAAALSRGMLGLATALRKRHAHADAAERKALDSLQLTLARAEALEAGAAEVKRTDDFVTGAVTATRVTQRERDLDDGTVVHLVGVVYRALRDSTATLATLVVPPLGELSRFFDRARPAPKPAAPSPPVA